MSEIAIRIENLGKLYHIGSQQERYKTLRDSLIHAITNPMRRFRNSKTGLSDQDTIWALKEVTFDIKQGEVVGIIGRNGAGKSTLLKILSHITEPTEGRVKLIGRVGSLLEVGTGFHPELTGRENIYLNGAILGMKKIEIERKFDEIVAFAEIEKFLNTPVKRYSSGMYVRLAFAVAAHLEPENLVVDEVLAVGDYQFQQKCLSKMGDIAQAGRTVLLVSHNMSSVINLCSRAILLEKGRILANGAARDIVERYMDIRMSTTGEIVWPDIHTAPGSEKARLNAVRILGEDNRPETYIDISKGFDIEIVYWNLQENARLMCTIQLMDRVGTMVLSSLNLKSVSVTPDPWADCPMPTGLYSTKCRIPGDFLNEGVYSLNVFIERYANVNEYLAHKYDAVSFIVQDTGSMRKEYSGGWGGVVRPRLEWKTLFLKNQIDFREA